MVFSSVVRFVLANTEVLHDKISVLANRVRQLEDALQEAHADRSSEPHPLLTAELLQLKRPLERESSESVKEPEVDAAEAIDAVGSLYAVFLFAWHPEIDHWLISSSRSISDSGHSKFFGTAASAWVCPFHSFAGGTCLTHPHKVSTSGTTITHLCTSITDRPFRMKKVETRNQKSLKSQYPPIYPGLVTRSPSPPAQSKPCHKFACLFSSYCQI